jgi:hypothetical protein
MRDKEDRCPKCIERGAKNPNLREQSPTGRTKQAYCVPCNRKYQTILRERRQIAHEIEETRSALEHLGKSFDVDEHKPIIIGKMMSRMRDRATNWCDMCLHENMRVPGEWFCMKCRAQVKAAEKIELAGNREQIDKIRAFLDFMNS